MGDRARRRRGRDRGAQGGRSVAAPPATEPQHLSPPLSGTGRGLLSIVATPLGNVEDLSPRAARVLREADRVLAEDTRRSGALLAVVGSTRPLHSLHEHNERGRIGQVLEWLERGEHIALVSDAGTPTVSDPGFPLVRAAAAAGHRVTPIPGPSAVTAAVSVAGLPTDRLLFLGFLPGRPGRRRRALDEALSGRATVVLFLSPHRLLRELSQLAEVAGRDRQACLCRELTKVHEEVQRGSLGTLCAAWEGRKPLGEFVIVVAGRPERDEDEADDVDEEGSDPSAAHGWDADEADPTSDGDERAAGEGSDDGGSLLDATRSGPFGENS